MSAADAKDTALSGLEAAANATLTMALAAMKEGTTEQAQLLQSIHFQTVRTAMAVRGVEEVEAPK